MTRPSAPAAVTPASLLVPDIWDILTSGRDDIILEMLAERMASEGSICLGGLGFAEVDTSEDLVMETPGVVRGRGDTESFIFFTTGGRPGVLRLIFGCGWTPAPGGSFPTSLDVGVIFTIPELPALAAVFSCICCLAFLSFWLQYTHNKRTLSNETQLGQINEMKIGDVSYSTRPHFSSVGTVLHYMVTIGNGH